MFHGQILWKDWEKSVPIYFTLCSDFLTVCELLYFDLCIEHWALWPQPSKAVKRNVLLNSQRLFAFLKLSVCLRALLDHNQRSQEQLARLIPQRIEEEENSKKDVNRYIDVNLEWCLAFECIKKRDLKRRRNISEIQMYFILLKKILLSDSHVSNSDFQRREALQHMLHHSHHIILLCVTLQQLLAHQMLISFWF